MILSSLTALIIPFTIGFMLLELVGNEERNSTLKIALSWPIGWGILAFALFILGILGIPYRIQLLHILFIILIFTLFFSHQVIKSQHKEELPIHHLNKQRAPLVEIIITLMAILFLIYNTSHIFLFALNIPIFTWDSVSTSIYNAKILFYEQDLASHRYFAHAEFPVGFTLMIAWFNLNLGVWSEQLYKIFFPLTFIFFLLFQYAYMKIFVTRRWAFASVLLLLTSNLVIYHSAVSYRDIIIMCYVSTSVALLSAWLKEPKRLYLLGSMLCIGFSTMIKSEGLAYLLIYFISFAFVLILNNQARSKQKMNTFLKYSLIPIIIVGIYTLYTHTHQIPSSPITNLSAANLLTKTSDALIQFFRILFLSANYNLLWITLIVSIVFNVKQIKNNNTIQFLLIFLILFMGLHFSLSVVSAEGWRIISFYTLGRLFLHVLPLVPILIVLLNTQKEEATHNSL